LIEGNKKGIRRVELKGEQEDKTLAELQARDKKHQKEGQSGRAAGKTAPYCDVRAL